MMETTEKAIDFIEMLEKEKFDSLIEYSRTEQVRLQKELLGQEYSEARKRARYNFTLLRFFVETLKVSLRDYAVFMLGTLLGVVQLVDKILLERNQNQWTNARYKKELKSVKHLSDIILSLETHGPMTHSELSKSLGMNPPTLTEAMKKVIETGVIQVSNIGKFKIYGLTDAGLRLGQQIRREKRYGKQGEQRLESIIEGIRFIKAHSDGAEKDNLLKMIRAEIAGSEEVSVRKKDVLKLLIQEGSENFSGSLVVDNILPDDSGNEKNRKIWANAHWDEKPFPVDISVLDIQNIHN